MKKMLLAVVVVVGMAGSTRAWQPAGWTWWTWPYVYDLPSGDWYWFETGNAQWAYVYPPGNGWSPLGQSGVAQGWSWWAWPYAYDSDTQGWSYLNEVDAPWCVNLRTGQWAVFGQPSATPPVPDGMVLIPAGSFQMGNAMSTAGYYDELPVHTVDELPVHTVYVSAFCMDKFEVTKALWDEVRVWGLNNGYTDLPAGEYQSTNHPVQSINWYAVVKWCNARSQKEGRPACYTVGGNVYKTGQVAPDCNWTASGYRLPTEAEWEKAARGGATGRRYPWSDSDTIQHTRANYYSKGNPPYGFDTSATRGYHPDYVQGREPHTSPVGSFAPNGYGLYDMAGNVSEWCWDWSDDRYYGSSPASNPRGPASGEYGEYRVFRGGSWFYTAFTCRVAERYGGEPQAASYTGMGFRSVMR